MSNTAVKALFQRRRRSVPESAGGAVLPQTGSRSDKPRYKVDLAAQQADCEFNYVRLCNLLVDFDARSLWSFAIGKQTTAMRVDFQIDERAPYTTTLTITQQHDADGAAPLAAAGCAAPRLTVRLYHDARMAEVIAWADHRRLRPRYEYPNSNMYHSDEKAQLNHFLRDLLSLCQSQGRVVTDMHSLGLPPR